MSSQHPMEEIRQENKILSRQVKRLVHTESELYRVQGELDQQITLYRKLYEIGKHLNTMSDQEEVFHATIQFILYELSGSRSLS